MTPLHVHKKQSQTTYLLEGDVKLRLPDRARICGPGGCLYQQIGVPHAEHVTSTGPARVLDINGPAGFDEFGFDRFVAAVGQPAKGMTLPEPVVEPDPEQLANLATRFGIDVLGPPGAVPSSPGHTTSAVR
jgi:hypothetical protein